MDEHIELVKKWLADKDSVSKEELKANKDAAYHATDYDADDAVADDVFYASCAACYSAYYAAEYAATAANVKAAAYWVKRYEELMNE